MINSILSARKMLAVDLSKIDYMCWQNVVLYDDWSDVYHIVEFEKESDVSPDNLQLNNNGDSGGCVFILCLVIAVITYYYFVLF